MTKSENLTVTYIDLFDAIERINKNPEKEHSIRAVTQDGTKVLAFRWREFEMYRKSGNDTG